MVCRVCGFETPVGSGQCPACGAQNENGENHVRNPTILPSSFEGDIESIDHNPVSDGNKSNKTANSNNRGNSIPFGLDNAPSLPTINNLPFDIDFAP